MDGQRAMEIDPRSAPVVAPAPHAGAPAATARRELPVWLAVGAGLLGPVVAAVCMALEPAPAHPDAPAPLLSLVVGYALLAAWLGAAATALGRRPAALGWAGGVAALSVVMSATCPSTGHHALGAWWYGQMAVCLAALTATVAALRWWAGRAAPS